MSSPFFSTNVPADNLIVLIWSALWMNLLASIWNPLGPDPVVVANPLTAVHFDLSLRAQGQPQTCIHSPAEHRRIDTPCLTSQSQTFPRTWTVARCSTSFGGWTIASARVLALELLEIHSLEEKPWTSASTAGARWPILVTHSAPTSVCACASPTNAPCHQHQDLRFAFASTKNWQVVMAGVVNSCLIGQPASVIPSGSTTFSALVSASRPLLPMAVLSLQSKWRSCASRAEPNWPHQWRVASCAQLWARVCASLSFWFSKNAFFHSTCCHFYWFFEFAMSQHSCSYVWLHVCMTMYLYLVSSQGASGSNVLCHQLKELPCFPASTCSIPRGVVQSL